MNGSFCSLFVCVPSSFLPAGRMSVFLLLPRRTRCFGGATVIGSSARVLFYLQPLWSSCAPFFKTPPRTCRCFLMFLIFLIFMVWLVLLCALVPGTIAFYVFTLFSVYSVSQSVTTEFVSRMKNQHGHWVY